MVKVNFTSSFDAFEMKIEFLPFIKKGNMI